MQVVSLLAGEWTDPALALAAFADEPWAAGLLSGGGGEAGRWSYLARAPEATLTVAPEDARDAFAALAAMIGPSAAAAPDGPPFQGGVIGLCGYELGDRIEQIGLPRRAGWPDIACARYPAVLTFDHAKQCLLAVGRGEDEGAARAQAERALGWLEAGAGRPPAAGALAAPPAASSLQAYEAAVAEVVERISRGEIFQANIARAWTGRLAAGARPFDLFARLAAQSPAPFAAYLRLEGQALVSNSPERFLQLAPREDGALWAQARPIKGTAPRGKDAAQDAALAAALAASPKDRAENLMIVDLMRNDIARVCVPGTVAAPLLSQVETFANVHHLVSTVEGRLTPGRTAADLLRAALPAGSITGAPKVQAMKVIAGLEPPRGPFFGTLFWAGADGRLDSNVLIRTAAFEQDADGWAFEMRAGAGIVADSLPRAERRESEAKISALLGALAG